jgi:hypothetical protein
MIKVQDNGIIAMNDVNVGSYELPTKNIGSENIGWSLDTRTASPYDYVYGPNILVGTLLDRGSFPSGMISGGGSTQSIVFASDFPYASIYVARYVNNPNNASQMGMRYDTTGLYTDTINTGDVFTVSGWVRINTGSSTSFIPQIGFTLSDNSTTWKGKDTIIPNDGKWHYVSFSRTVQSNETVKTMIAYIYTSTSVSSKNTLQFDVALPKYELDLNYDPTDQINFKRWYPSKTELSQYSYMFGTMGNGYSLDSGYNQKSSWSVRSLGNDSFKFSGMNLDKKNKYLTISYRATNDSLGHSVAPIFKYMDDRSDKITWTDSFYLQNVPYLRDKYWHKYTIDLSQSSKWNDNGLITDISLDLFGGITRADTIEIGFISLTSTVDFDLINVPQLRFSANPSDGIVFDSVRGNGTIYNQEGIIWSISTMRLNTTTTLLSREEEYVVISDTANFSIRSGAYAKRFNYLLVTVNEIMVTKAIPAATTTTITTIPNLTIVNTHFEPYSSSGISTNSFSSSGQIIFTNNSSGGVDIQIWSEKGLVVNEGFAFQAVIPLN